MQAKPKPLQVPPNYAYSQGYVCVEFSVQLVQIFCTLATRSMQLNISNAIIYCFRNSH